MGRVLQLVSLILLSSSFFPARAAAEPRFAVAAGYTVTDGREDVLPIGWFISMVAMPLAGNWLGVVSEIGGEYNSLEASPRPIRQRAFTFLDGPRLIGNAGAHTTGFVEMLVGVQHDVGFMNTKVNENRFASQVSAGADLQLATYVSARFQVAARTTYGDDSRTALRLLTGIVLGPPRSPKKRDASGDPGDRGQGPRPEGRR
jgi:hypothetical protein